MLLYYIPLIFSESKVGLFYSILCDNFYSYSITCVYISFSRRSENIFQKCNSLFLSQGSRSDAFLIFISNLKDKDAI